MNILAVRKYLTLKPFDVTTEQGRSDERYRLAMLSMTANVLSRGVAMIVMVLTVRLTIPYLGAERFGVWMTIASFAGMLSFLDLGVGNALANRVSQVAAENDNEALRRTISGGLGFLFLIGILVGILLFALSSALPWQKIIKVQELAVTIETKNAVQIFVIMFGVSLFSNGIQRVFAGLQQSFFSHIVSLFGSAFSLLALWQATRYEASITILLIATLGTQLLTNLLLLFILTQRNLLTKDNFTDNVKSESVNLFSAGGLFLVLQLGTMVGWGADSLIIAGTLGASQVAIFNIAQRLYQFISQPLGIINGPLWGAYADAHARGEKGFIKKTLKRSLVVTVLCSTLAGSVLFVFGDRIIRLWTYDSIEVSIILIFIFFIWTVCETLGNAFAMFLNGCGIVREQVITVVVLTAIALPAKFVCVSYYGIAGMQLSYTIIYLLVVLFFYGYFFRSRLKKAMTA